MNFFTGIVKSAKRGLLYTVLATKKMEEQHITQLGTNEGNIVRKYEKNSLANDLLNGRQTKRAEEYTKRFYALMENADKLDSKKNFKFIPNENPEEESQIVMLSDLTDEEYTIKNSELIEKLRDKSDNYQIEYIEEFKKVIVNNNDLLGGAKPIYESNIRFFSGDDEVLINDELISGVHVKNIEQNNKMIDLIFTYNDIYTELFESIMVNPHIILTFDSIAILHGKYKPQWYNYHVQEFDKMITPSKGRSVFKFRAEYKSL